jgi:neutral amino acid transport system permease protein
VNLLQAVVDGLRAGLGVPAAAYALAATGLNLQFGYGGLINVGQVGFLLVGAYGSAMALDAGAPLVIGVAVGVGASIVLALVLGLSTLRLRADYLAIVTLAAAEILRLGVRSRPLEGLTGGVFGITGFADPFYDLNPIPVGRYGLGDLAFNHRSLWLIVVSWSLVALSTAVVWRLVHSPWGRVLQAVRDDEDLARALGKNAFRFKVQSFVVGGAIGSLGGIALAFDAQFVDPDFWVLTLTTYAFTVVVLGGKGTIRGPVVGSIVFWFVVQATDTLLRQALEQTAFDAWLSPEDAGPIRFALVGLALILIMVFRPDGVLGRPGPPVGPVR